MLNSPESPIEVVDFIEMGRDTNSRVDQAAVERSWRERGFSYGLRVDPPGQVWTDYVHDTDELVMVVEGDVEFEIDGRVHRPPPNWATVWQPWERIHSRRTVLAVAALVLQVVALSVLATGRG